MEGSVAPPAEVLKPASDRRLVACMAVGQTIGWGTLFASFPLFGAPLEAEFGWSRATTSGAVTANLVIYGLTAPFAAALMNRFGIRRVVSIALVLVATGSGLTVFMPASWQLVLLWGVLVGLGTGSMALAFVALSDSALLDTEVARSWLAAAVSVVLALPRLFVYDVTYMMVGAAEEESGLR